MAATSGASIIQVHNYIATAAISQSELKPVLESYAPLMGSPIAVVYSQKRYLWAKVRVFVDFMSDLMAQLRQEELLNSGLR